MSISRGKRVAVIGTGASAIQIVPAIADRPSDTSRCSSGRRPGSCRGTTSRSPTSRRPTFAARPLDARRHRQSIYRFYEGNTIIKVDDRRVEVFEKFARAHLENSVPDPDPARQAHARLPDRLQADPALERPSTRRCSATTSSSSPTPSTTSRRSGIVTADGTEHPLDVIVLATGYRATDYLYGLEVVGTGRSTVARRMDRASRLSRHGRTPAIRTSSSSTARTPTRAATRSC